MVIELFYARGGQERGEPYITAHVFVKVENIAYHKKVWVQGIGFRGFKNEARYLFQLDDKHEVWYGKVDEYMKASSHVAFDIECIVDEKLYRDGTFAIGSVYLYPPRYKKKR